jgi:redox-sensitive bicupin YhaK (pirin superfamily)
MDTVTTERAELLVLGPEDYATLDADDFGVEGLVATEVIGPFVRLQAVGPLIMVHDGVFDPHRGIGHHPHRFNERLFYILEGAVDHDDALNGIQGHMGTGDLGRLTEGRRGMLHREWNHTDGRARAFILVYRTDPVPARASFAVLRDAEAARYEEGPGVETKEVVGPRVSFPLHGDLRLFTDSRLAPGAGPEVRLGRREGALLFPVEGTFELAGGVAVPPGLTVVVPPDGDGRGIRVTAREAGRILRAVFGPGLGLVVREPLARPLH